MPNRSFQIIACLILASMILAPWAHAIPNPGEPQIYPANFLLLPDIPEMTLDFALAWTDSAAGFFIKPYDAVVLHVMVNGSPFDAFVFSDIGMQRLLVWLCEPPDPQGNRSLTVISEYEGEDAGYFMSPSGLATNAIGRQFDPDSDVVYLADRGHDRIVELSYTPDKDGGRFRFNRSIGENELAWPVDVCVSAYLNQTPSNADLYVVDKGRYPNPGSLHRYDLAGNLEYESDRFTPPGHSDTLCPLTDPVAVQCCPDTVDGNTHIFITEAYNHAIIQVSGNSNDAPAFRSAICLKATSSYMEPGGIAFDDYGRVYIANKSACTVQIYGPYLIWVYSDFGVPGYYYGVELNYPNNIVIDSYYGFCEAMIIENYGRQAGFKYFTIANGSSLSHPQMGFAGGNLVKPVVKTAAPIPKVYELKNSYPNPFNAYCIIRFALPQPSPVKLEIFNVLGQQVATILDEVREAGDYSALFKAGEFSSGVYFVKMQAGNYRATKSIVLLK